jgi:dTDP-4-dehydrorhamnose 3,5-epimerase
MPITVTPTAIPEVLVIEPEVFGDKRGFFFESFNARDFREATGLDVSFVQDNHSGSSKGVLRGLHYQIQKPQGKLVRVVSGEIFDVAVDLRRSSATFGRWVGEILSAENRRQLWIPPGFAHGFQTVSVFAEVNYKATAYYDSDDEVVLQWNDHDLGVEWPSTTQRMLSEKDLRGQSLASTTLYGRDL